MCKKFLSVFIILTMVLSYQTSSTASTKNVKATGVSVRIDADGLYNAMIGLYFFEHSDGIEEKGTTYTWYVSEQKDGIYVPVENSNVRKLRILPSMAGKYYKFGVIPKASSGEIGDMVLSTEVLATLDPVYEIFKDSLVFCVDSNKMLQKGLRQMVNKSNPQTKVVYTDNDFLLPVKTIVQGFGIEDGSIGDDFATVKTIIDTLGLKSVWSPKRDMLVLSKQIFSPISDDLWNEAKSRLLYNDTYNNMIVQAKSFFSKFNWSNPELAPIKDLVQNNQYIAALESYRNIFVDHMAVLGNRKGFQEISGMGSGGTKADELLNGTFTMINYGSRKTKTFYLGQPGYIQWYPVYGEDVAIVVHSTPMYMLDVLVNEFKNTGDIKYAERWADLVEDNFMYSYDQWQHIKASPMAKYSPYFEVVWNYGFYSMLRAIAVHSQLASIAKYNPDKLKLSLSGLALSKIVNTMIDKNNTKLFATIIPNQELNTVKALVMSAVVYKDFLVAASYNETASVKSENYFNAGFLPDGSDLEQAPSYNIYGMIYAFTGIMSMFDNDQFPWIEDIWYYMVRMRLNFLASILKMNRQFPNLYNSGEAEQQVLLKRAQSIVHEPIAGKIIDRVFNNGSVSPDFNSIYFPYGGYFVMRDNWDKDSKYLFMKKSRRGNGHFDESFNHIVLNAFGENMLVGGGGVKYAPHWVNEFMHSSLSKNSISVDGYPQAIGAEPKQASSYTSPIENDRWFSNDEFDFGEGIYNKSYGITKLEKDKPIQKISDVTHQRQVINLRKQGIFIVTDKLVSNSLHTYEQNWNFSRIYSASEVTANGEERWIKTCSGTKPNLSIYTITSQPITTKLYYGENSNIIRGFYKILYTDDPIPIVESATTFTSDNGGVIISILYPHLGTNDNLLIENIGSGDGIYEGVRITTDDGTVVEYKCATRSRVRLEAGGLSAVGEGILTLQQTGKPIKGILLSGFSLGNGTNNTILQYPNSQFEFQPGQPLKTKIIRAPVKFEMPNK